MSEKNDVHRIKSEKPVQVFLPKELHAAWRAKLREDQLTAREALIYIIKKYVGWKDGENKTDSQL